jgi:hypothetical protein
VCRFCAFCRRWELLFITKDDLRETKPANYSPMKGIISRKDAKTQRKTKRRFAHGKSEFSHRATDAELKTN